MRTRQLQHEKTNTMSRPLGTHAFRGTHSRIRTREFSKANDDKQEVWLLLIIMQQEAKKREQEE